MALEPVGSILALQQGKLAGLTASLITTIGRWQKDPWFMWTLISLSSTAGILAEKTNIGAMLSSPLVTMGISLVLCNVGLLPAKSPIYDIVIKYLVPLAIPLLLLDADIRKCLKYTGTLMKAFLIGSMGTVLGTFLAYYFVPMRNTAGSPLIAAALCARHVSNSFQATSFKGYFIS